MKIKKLQIKNFKSLVDVELINPNPFSVFVGPNASGKSNIFEAIQFFRMQANRWNPDVINKFGGFIEVANFNSKSYEMKFKVDFGKTESSLELDRIGEHGTIRIGGKNTLASIINESNNLLEDINYRFFFIDNSRIFVKNNDVDKDHFNDDSKLTTDCSNLEKVLKRILQKEMVREEITEWLQLLIPGFEKIEIESSSLSGRDDILIFEKGTMKPFGKELISDGTYNILCLLTACYQSDEPQFLCIEEPENGLNPFVVRELVNLFKDRCDEGHYIWVNTHSQTLVSRLNEEEIILVDKIDGETRVKQIASGKAHGMRMDEAWFTKMLGGGTPF